MGKSALKTKRIRRRCSCGCGGTTKRGNRFIRGHYWGGKERSKEDRRKMSIGRFHNKYFDNDIYCDAWSDKEFKTDCRKDYCKNKFCKNKSPKQIDLHHINLNKKDCHILNLITLCASCHAQLHHQLMKISRKGYYHFKECNKSEFIIIIRKDRIVYICKRTKKKVKICLNQL